MKKLSITGTSLISSFGIAAAQGLYDLAPNDEAQESSPISWSAGLNYNYDDNVTPSALAGTPGYEEDASSISAYLGATLVSITPQSTWDVFARVGANAYIDSPSAAGADDMNYQARLGVNWAHRVSERLRFSSRNHIALEMEPDYAYGFATDRQLEEYLHYQTDNAVGYRWTERFATYTGFTISGLAYGSAASADDNDRTTYSIYQQFRYTATEQTNWTLDYRYSDVAASGSAGDSGNHYILVGVEHRFSPNSVIAVKAGTQIRDVDGGSGATTPYLDLAIRTQVNEQFGVRVFTRYSVEDYGTSFTGATYDTNNTLRVGVSADYTLSPRLTLNAGINAILSDLEDGRATVAGGVAPADADTDLINLYLGFSYQVNEGVYVTGSYNWTDSDSDIAGRNYDRNNVSLGLRVLF